MSWLKSAHLWCIRSFPRGWVFLASWTGPLERRNLTASQRACIAAEMKPFYVDEAKHRMQARYDRGIIPTGTADAEVGKLMNVGEATVRRADSPESVITSACFATKNFVRGAVKCASISF